MSLFEYDQGHLIPAQFGHAVGQEAQREVLESVRNQVLEVIARPLFPVTWNDIAFPATPVVGLPPADESETNLDASPVGTSPHSHAPNLNESNPSAPSPNVPNPSAALSPRLTALDGSGQVVLVEVMEKLDSQSLIESLARLGAVSNLGWNDLAAAYPGGVVAFRSGWTQFRDAMPPNLSAGPRLILVVTAIDPSVRPALDALTVSGLEVHHVSVREMSNGRRFLDVQRVVASLFSHDTHLLAGRGARTPALTSGVTPADLNPVNPMPNRENTGRNTGGKRPGDPGSRAGRNAEVDEPQLQTGTISRHDMTEAVAETSYSPRQETSSREAESSVSAGNTHPGGKQTQEAHLESAYVPVWREPGARRRNRHTGESARASRLHETAAKRDSAHRETKPDWFNTPAIGTKNETERDADLLNHDKDGLNAIAQVTGEDTPIFAQVSPAQSPEPIVIQATLLEGGDIVLEGRSFTSPRDAADSIGAGQDLDGDGWNFWHLGIIDGPTLAEACEEINVELRREKA